MKYYSPSNELAEILFKNGFIETTDKFYKSNNSGDYNPDKDRRCFSLVKDKRGFVFWWNDFRFYNAENNLKSFEESITENQLISIIAFYKLSHPLRKSLERDHKDIMDLQKYINDNKNLAKYKDKVESVEQAISDVFI